MEVIVEKNQRKSKTERAEYVDGHCENEKSTDAHSLGPAPPSTSIKILTAKEGEIISSVQRPNSRVGIILIHGTPYFFKERDIDILVQEMKAAELVERHGFRTPTLVDFRVDGSKGMMIQEFISDITNRNLAGLIQSSDTADKKTLRNCFKFLFQSSIETLCAAKCRGPNDRFLWDRAEEGGRIQQNYHSQTFALGSRSISFEELLDCHFTVDGVQYRETFGELIAKSKEALSPDTLRPMWFSHGDIVETNIYNASENEMDWGLIDLEVTGVNWCLSDIVIPLIGTGYMFDYTLPRYSPSNEHGVCTSSKPACTCFHVQEEISLSRIGGFYASPYRREACIAYLEEFARPLLIEVQKLNALFNFSIDDQLRAIFFMRMIGAHNFVQWSPNDQQRVFGLTYKLCGTPQHGHSKDVLSIFKELL